MSYLKMSSVSVLIVAARQAELAGRVEQRLADLAADDDGAATRSGARSTFSRTLSPSKRQFDAVASRRGRSGRRAAAPPTGRSNASSVPGLQARQRLLRAGLVEHAVHRRRRAGPCLRTALPGSGRARRVTICQLSPVWPRSLATGQRRQRQGEGGAAPASARGVGMARSAKPGTMAATSTARVANRLACAHWRRVQRPLKPAGRRASTWRWSAASRRTVEPRAACLSMPDLPMLLTLRNPVIAHVSRA